MKIRIKKIGLKKAEVGEEMTISTNKNTIVPTSAPTSISPEQEAKMRQQVDNLQMIDIKKNVDWNAIANLTTNGISAWANEANKRKNNRMFKQAKMNQLFNQTIMPGGNKGMYDINTGMPMYSNVNQGMYGNAFYSPQQFAQEGGETEEEVLPIPGPDDQIVVPSDYDTADTYIDTTGKIGSYGNTLSQEELNNEINNQNFKNNLLNAGVTLAGTSLATVIGNKIRNSYIKNKIQKDFTTPYAQKHLKNILDKTIKKEKNILLNPFVEESYLAKQLEKRGFTPGFVDAVYYKTKPAYKNFYNPKYAELLAEKGMMDEVGQFLKSAGKSFAKTMEKPKNWFKKQDGGELSVLQKLGIAGDYINDYLNNYNILDIMGHSGNPLMAMQAMEAAHNNKAVTEIYKNPLNSIPVIKNTADIGQYLVPYYGTGLMTTEALSMLPSNKYTAAEKVGNIAGLGAGFVATKSLPKILKNPKGKELFNMGINTIKMLTPSTNKEMGGEQQLNSMKIRIKSIPKQSMAFGGQTNYALDIKRDYNVDGKQPYEQLSGTLQPVDRRLANVEAEKGETVYGDLDGDGGLEHMKIGGNRHHSGGTPLNLPEDSFIYSDTQKMKIKDPESLAFFGLKPKNGGYTPAEIAKKYDINKYKSVMEDPNADDFDKTTAQLMVNNYQDKLSRLAIIQEEMKGFPQGIPKVAEEYAMKKGLIQSPQEEMQEQGYEQNPQEEMMETEEGMRYGGNLTKAQFGVETKSKFNPSNIVSSILENANPLVVPYSRETLMNMQPHLGDKYSGRKNASKYSREEWGEKLRNIGYTGNFSNKDIQKFLYSTPEGKAIIDSSHKIYGTPSGGMFDDILGIRWDEALDAIKSKKVNKNITTDNLTGNNNASRLEYNPNEIKKIRKENYKNFQYLTPDLVNMAATAAYAPELILGYNPQMPFTPGRVTLQDPRAQLAAQQAAYNSYADTLGIYSPSQAISSGLSYTQGQQADKAAQILAQNQAANVAIANQFDQTERQRQDQNNLFNLSQKQQNWRDYATAKQNYRQEKVDYAKANAEAFGKAWDNRMKMQLMNKTNKLYNIDPRTGKMYFKEGYGPEDIGREGIGVEEKLIQGFLNLKEHFPKLTESQYIRLLSGGKEEKKYGGSIKKKKQINPIFDMLSQGHQFPF